MCGSIFQSWNPPRVIRLLVTSYIVIIYSITNIEVGECHKMSLIALWLPGFEAASSANKPKDDKCFSSKLDTLLTSTHLPMQIMRKFSFPSHKCLIASEPVISRYFDTCNGFLHLLKTQLQ